MLCVLLALSDARAGEPLRLAAAEVGTAAGSLSYGDGVQARAELSTGNAVHVGVQASWNGGGPMLVVGDSSYLYAKTAAADVNDIRALATLGVHADDTHVQVGVGLAVGPWVRVAHDLPTYDAYSKESTTYSGTDTTLAAFWTTSIRVRIVDGVGLYLASTGDLSTFAVDGSFGIGWTR